jgi:hypothetical protein
MQARRVCTKPRLALSVACGRMGLIQIALYPRIGRFQSGVSRTGATSILATAMVLTRRRALLRKSLDPISVGIPCISPSTLAGAITNLVTDGLNSRAGPRRLLKNSMDILIYSSSNVDGWRAKGALMAISFHYVTLLSPFLKTSCETPLGFYDWKLPIGETKTKLPALSIL